MGKKWDKWNRASLYIGLVMWPLLVANSFLVDSFSTMDRVVAITFFTAMLGLSCYYLFTARGRRQFSRQPKKRWADERTGRLVVGWAVLVWCLYMAAFFVVRPPLWAGMLVGALAAGAVTWVGMRLILLTDSSKGRRSALDATSSAS